MEGTIWVYILKGANGKHYTGITNDPIRRFNEHRGGQSKSTKGYGEIKVLWLKGYNNRERAREIEVLIKKKGARNWLKTYTK